ncbi:MAG: stage II sporulation protein M [Candidatus Nanohaloarchaea archaeon]|nr:stage II sporulation protein M [Candidatus Nanohaloarchaea archaeon]
MLETVLFRADEDDEELLIDTVLATAIATAASLLLVNTVLPFQIGGIDFGGLITVVLITLALSYPLTSFIKRRDREELRAHWDEPHLLRRHAEEVQIYLLAFLTSTLLFAASVLVLPDSFYIIQQTALEALNAAVGNITADSFFLHLITNNMRVFIATFALSFFISGGMVFIIIWNASVLGVLIGRTSEHVLSIPIQTAPYLVHGSLEVAAYILAGLAGTLLAIDTETYFTSQKQELRSFTPQLRDIVALLSLGLLLLLLAGMIEA